MLQLWLENTIIIALVSAESIPFFPGFSLFMFSGLVFG